MTQRLYQSKSRIKDRARVRNTKRKGLRTKATKGTQVVEGKRAGIEK